MRVFLLYRGSGHKSRADFESPIRLAGSVYAAEKPAEIPSQRYDGDG